MKIEKWLKLNTKDLSGKTVAITGSTGGIGAHLSMYLAELNANLIFLNRSENKSIDLINKIHTRYPNVKIEFIALNLLDIENVRTVTNELKNREIDVLILNAGVYNVPRFLTTSGYDNVFMTNFVSQYFIARELIPTLTKTNGKIVAVGSIAHKYSKIDKEDIDFRTRSKASLVYGNSKRYLMGALSMLVKDNESVGLSIVHPGITLTNMTNHYPRAINWLAKIGINLLFPPAEIASLSVVNGVFLSPPYMHWIGPKRFDIWGRPCVKPIRDISDEEIEIIHKNATKIYNQLLHINKN